MKIYTEVNYEWKNDSLVQTSSESFDYSGDIALCGGGGGGSSVTKLFDQTVGAGVEAIKNPAKTIKHGPGGTLGDIADKAYGGTLKEIVEQIEGRGGDAETPDAPVLSAEEVDPQGALTAQNKKRQELAGRGAANLTAGQSATMLTA